MWTYSVRNIPARWLRLAASAALALVCATALTASLSAQSFEALADRYRKTPTPRTRAAVIRYAQAHRTTQNGALALLLLGVMENDAHQYGDALTHLTAARKRLPQLADYIGYFSAVAGTGLRQFSDTEAALKPVWESTPASSLVAKAALLQASSYLQVGNPQAAIDLLQKYRSDLPVTPSELLLARAYEAQNNTTAAAGHYEKIYIDYPLSKEASEAAAALMRYPAPPADALLTRGLKLLNGGDFTRAGKQLTTILPRLSGENYDLARVRIGVADYRANENLAAYKYLTSFAAAAPDAEAERLYYLLQCQRRLNRPDEVAATLDHLSHVYPQSPWRLQALVSVGNYYLAHDQPADAQQYYTACYESFPGNAQSAACHWKVAWFTYLHDPAQAESMLRQQLTMYPASDQTSPALYYLGRIAESKSDWTVARAYYDALNKAYPNYYYAIQARERLDTPSVADASASPATLQFLARVEFSSKQIAYDFVPNALTKQRIARAHLLDIAGLNDWAEAELRFGANADGQPQVMALQLAELASEHDAPDRAIRYIKHYAPGYLSMPLDAAPERFWRLAFPLPYWSALKTYCRAESLDPYLMAALIRQESEFNAKAVSPANARGLAQVMPSTGRQLSRKLRMRYRTSMLFRPDTNLKLGTYYMRQLSDKLQGKWEAVLASYNAGTTHVTAWMAAANYREPAEFVESIPFAETRGYVQSVLRNAEVYRKIYGAKLTARNQ